MKAFAKNLTSRGKRNSKTAETMSPEVSDRASITSVASTSQAESQIVIPTPPRRAATTMEAPKARGLVLPQPPRPAPLVEVTRGVDVEGTVVRSASPPQNNGSNEFKATTTTTTSSTTNTTTSTATTIHQLRRMVGNNALVVARRDFQRPAMTKTGVKLHAITDFTLEFYLRYISDERIKRMPDRGSPWDRVLHAAQFFGLHISQFGDRLDAFLHGDLSNGLVNGETGHDIFFEGASIGAFFNGQKNVVPTNSAKDLVFAALASSHALLEIGHTHAQALLPTFAALYEVSVLLTDITRIQSLEDASQAIRHDVTKTYNSLVTLLNNMAAVYHQKVSELRPGSTAHIDFDASFGAQIEEIWRSKETLSDAIWKQKLREAEHSMTATQLRWKLQYPYNYSIANRIYDKVGDYHSPPSKTCYWLKGILADFFSKNDQLLCVTGRESSGKTILARWVEERLARPLNVKSYHVLRYTFPFDAPDRATPTAFIKSILSTLLEQNISNVNVYKAIAQAFGDESAATDSEPREAVLWKALHDCLAAVRIRQATMVIVLDDCEEIIQGDANFYSKLQGCITGLPVRVVSFCRSVSTAVQEHEREIEASRVREDIRVYIQGSLSRSRCFRNLSPQESEEILKGMVVKANGSWLWAFYAVRLVSKENSAASIIKTSHDLGPSVSDLLHKVVESLQLEQNPELRTILSILLVATRPLRVPEIGQLLSIDLHKRSMSLAPDIAGLISQSLGDLVTLHGGYVHFRTKTVRSFLKEQLGSMSLPSEQTAHEQLTLRMLLYAKLTLKEIGGSSTTVLDYDLVLSRFSTDSLLGYVVQNWVEHFQASGFTGPEVLDVFPNSVTFALFERTCWTRVYTQEKLVFNHKLALQVRHDCFGDQDVTVLYALVTLGYIYLNVLGSKSDAAWHFYSAAKLGSDISSESSTVVKSCMHFFLDYAAMMEITDRVRVDTTHTGYQMDIVTCYEDMLRLAIEIDRHRYGESSDEVLSWYQKLAKLYADIREEERAMYVYQEIRAIIIARDGTDSGRAKQMNAYFATLDIVLEGASVDKVGELEQMIFEVNENVEVTDLWCIKLWLRLARSYESCDHLSLAERLYVGLWQRITLNQAPADNVDVHLVRIDIALEYARFLCRHDRLQEACSILICLWAEYQNHVFESEALVIRIRDVANECRKSGLADIAVAMLTKVLESFSYSHSEEIQKTVLLMNEVVEEITDTTVTKNTSTTTVVTEQTERVVKKLFERLVDQYEQNRYDTSLFTAAKALNNFYNQQKNWREAETTLRKTLELTWNEILTESSSTGSSAKLCEHSIEECLGVARQLAACFSTQGLFQDAERIHWQIFKACISVKLEENLGTPESRLTGAQLLVDAITTLVAFYEKHHRHREVIDVYTLVLEKYRLELGQRHNLTIRALYFLAAYHNDLGLEKAYDYYAEIVTVLNEGLDYCHQDAIKAALALLIHYDARKRWDSLQLICTALWETILRRRGKQIEEQADITGETVAAIYEKYSHVLDFHVKVDFSVLHHIAVEYRDIIHEGYYDKPELVINSLVTLAKICETNEKHHEESIKAYEQVLEQIKTTKTSNTIEETIVDTVKKRLSRMYVTVVKGSQKTTFSLDRAIEISLEAYEQYRAAFKEYPEQTLNQLECLILLYQQVNTAESQERICALLEASARYIITMAAVNLTLFHAATSLAALFVSAGLASNGKNLLQELRHKVIYGDRFLQQDVQPGLDAHTRKAVFIFLIAFGHGLEQYSESLSYSKIMAEIVLESLLYEEFSRVNHSEASLEVVLQYGARLRSFWQACQRTELTETLDRDLMYRFKSAYAHYFDVNCSKQVRESFYYCLMEELGKDRPTVKFDFETFMLQIGNEQVKNLLYASEFYTASQVSRFVFQYAKERNLYHDRSRIRYGYTLAQYLVGIGAPHPDNDDGRSMSETSRYIMDDVIDAFYKLEMDFERLRSEDLVGLVHLLQAQSNYKQLEIVLSCLWRFKGDIHATFGGDAQKVIEIGTCLVHAQCAQKKYRAAIETARQLYYNLQRARGRLDRETLEVTRLVASIHATMASQGEDEDLENLSYAMDIHENVLREIASPSGVVYNGYTRHDPEFLAEQAWIHSSLLNSLRLQLKDSQSKHWVKRERDIGDLYQSLQDELRFNETIKGSYEVPPWQYAPPKTWRFEEPEAGEVTNGVNRESANVLETAQREWVLTTRILG